jgi:hypothetical protein
VTARGDVYMEFDYIKSECKNMKERKDKNTNITESTLRESDDFLFHYTQKYESLVSIMKDSFKPFYCLEKFDFIIDEPNDIGFPMVCFCDIPYERHVLHKNKYGQYGIGLKKEWGIMNHLNPVIYTYPDSTFASALENLAFEYLNNRQNQTMQKSVSIILMLSKPYDGPFYDKTKHNFSQDKRCFYDEKEWRYIPINLTGIKVAIEGKIFEDSIKLERMNKEIQSPDNILNFDVSDIEYIFLQSDSEIDCIY